MVQQPGSLVGVRLETGWRPYSGITNS
jgi:hypothetical protein